MAMAVSPLNDFALTVSPDHIVGRYNLNVGHNGCDHSFADFLRLKMIPRPTKTSWPTVQSIQGMLQLLSAVTAEFVQ